MKNKLKSISSVILTNILKCVAIENIKSISSLPNIDGYLFYQILNDGNVQRQKVVKTENGSHKIADFANTFGWFKLEHSIMNGIMINVYNNTEFIARDFFNKTDSVKINKFKEKYKDFTLDISDVSRIFGVVGTFFEKEPEQIITRYIRLLSYDNACDVIEFIKKNDPDDYAYITVGGVSMQVSDKNLDTVIDYIKSLNVRYEIGLEAPYKVEQRIVENLKNEKVI